jgi:hypothetical protein
MKTEFLVDENSNVWFTFASNIHYREMDNKLVFNKVDSSKAALNFQQHQQQKKDMLLKELQEYEASLQDTTTKKDQQVKNKMLDFMTGYYDKMKGDMGINANYGVEKDDADLDAVLKQLKPNTTAKNFRDFLTKRDNVFKNQNWRQTARKVHASDDRKIT